jgi:hypothetical protein
MLCSASHSARCNREGVDNLSETEEAGRETHHRPPTAREFLQTVLSEIRVDGADLSIVFALNFEAALAALGGTPNGPGCGMARNCIGANGASSRSPVTANGKRVAAANALLAVEQELQPGIETDRVRFIAVRLWSAGKPQYLNRAPRNTVRLQV